MAITNKNPIEHWTRMRAVVLSLVCLLVGIAGGWFIRGLHTAAGTGSANALSLSTQAEHGAGSALQRPGTAGLKEMADAQAAPLLDQLRSEPNKPDLLTSIGNIYYDAQQYPIAVDYYGRALKTRPADAAVRTDMATAYWYMGDADSAIAEFNKALAYAPNNPNALFNLGLVKWKGKADTAGAVADWEKLLAANPKYGQRDKVEQMLTEVKNHAAVKQ